MMSLPHAAVAQSQALARHVHPRQVAHRETRDAVGVVVRLDAGQGYERLGLVHGVNGVGGQSRPTVALLALHTAGHGAIRSNVDLDRSLQHVWPSRVAVASDYTAPERWKRSRK